VTDREVLPGCARVRTKCAEKTKCWSVGTDYILEKLPDVSGPGLVEAGRYNKLVLVVAIHPLDGSRANWHSKAKPSASAAHPLTRWGSSKPQAFH